MKSKKTGATFKPMPLNNLPSDRPFLVEVVMEHTGDDGTIKDSFFYFNDIEVTNSDINALFCKLLDMGDIIAPRYNLPQLAPVDHIEESGKDGHPYSRVLKMSGLSVLSDENRIDDVGELEELSHFYSYVNENKDSELYTKSLFNYHLNKSLENIKDLHVNFDALKLNLEPIKKLMGEIKKLVDKKQS